MRLGFRCARFIAASLALALLIGCGGETSNSFARSVYVEITSTGTLNPAAMTIPGGYRVVFLNDDSVPHTINWGSPVSTSATAQPGNRAWFDLPPILPGTVLSYRLDSSGPTGSVTVASTLNRAS